MLPQRFDQAKPFITLGVVLVAWLLIPTAVKRLARVTFFEMQAPVEVTASYVRDLQTFWSLKSRSNNELIEAGQDLVRLNSAYEVRLQQDAALRAELDRLQTLLKLPQPVGFRSEPARIVRRDFSAWWQQMTIRKGRNYGISVGAPVIYAGGVVGRVREVNAYTSVVELISSPGLRIAATAEGDTRPISYQGGINPSFGPAVGTVEYVPLDIFVSNLLPRKLVTSGLGGVFPPNLTIGMMTRVEPSSDGLFKTGDVRLDPALSGLTEVTVLVPDASAEATSASTAENTATPGSGVSPTGIVALGLPASGVRSSGTSASGSLMGSSGSPSGTGSSGTDSVNSTPSLLSVTVTANGSPASR